jgi:tetratricopeptide (TPR) repeat protein/transglutaminase-like putative cysteine protease
MRRSKLDSWSCGRQAAIIVVCAVVAVQAVASPASDGWQKLARNQNAEAAAAFRSALKANASDADALRGLAILSGMENADARALEQWASFCHAAPASWQAAAWWPEVVQDARETGRWTLLDAAARDIVAARGVAPEMTASARLALADAADRAGRAADAEAQWSRMGFLRQWRVCGPFDNISRSGFDKRCAPESGIDFSKSLTGKDDRLLRWHGLGVVSRDGQCEVGQALGDSGASVFYAAGAIFSPKEQQARLCWDPTGASKVWLNGRLVLTDSIYRIRQPLIADPFCAPVTLHAGWNTLLVKVADEYGDQASFAIRFTTPAGADLPPLRADFAFVSARPVDPAPSSTESGAATVAVPAMAARIRNPETDIEAAAALARWLSGMGGYEAAIGTLRTAIAHAPDCAWLHAELSAVLHRDRQADDARAERDLVRKLNPGIVSAELDYLTDENQGIAASDVITRLKKLRQNHPQSAEVLWALSDAYSRAKMNAEALQTARAAYGVASGPENANRLYEFYTGEERVADGKAALAAGLRLTPNDETLLMTLADSLAEEGKSAAAAAELKKFLSVCTPWPHIHGRLAALYRSTKDLRQAAAELQIAHGQRPQDGSLCEELGDVLKELGRKPEAISLYQEAIRLDPSNVRLRERQQIISGDRPAMDLVPATPAGPMIAAARAAKADGASAILFLDEGRQLVYPDFAAVCRYHRIVKVFDQAGVERFQTIQLARPESSSNVTVETARILKPDGKIQNVADSAAGREEQDSIALPSLAPGDIVDIAYRVETFRRGALSRQFWSEWFVDVPEAAVKLSRYVFMTPPSLKFATSVHGHAPEPKTTEVKGWRVTEWRTTDVPPHKLEALGVGRLDAGVWIDISTVPSWDLIARWYQDLSRPRCVPDNIVRAKAAELTRGAKSEEEKLHAIIAFVRSLQYQTTPFRMSAYVPTEGRRVLSDRFADCKDKAALLAALLACVDIRCDMALVSGRSHGTTPYLPSPRFNHAIAVVHTPSGPLWVDSTADQMAVGDFPSEDQGVPALVINDSTKELTTTPAAPSERDLITETYDMSLEENGRLAGTADIRVTGNLAWELRSVLSTVPVTKRQDALRGMAGAFVKGSTYESGSLEGLDEPDKPLIIRLKIHADDFASKTGNLLLVKLPWTLGHEASDSMLADPGRQQPLEVSAVRAASKSVVTLRLPAGYSVLDLQPETKGDSPWASYRMSCHVEGGVLHAVGEQKITALRVPLADVKPYLEILRATRQEAGKQLVLKKS